MGLRCAIHQLHYLPWLRYFEKIARADVFIVLDNVQFVKNEWHNRNKIKSKQGAQILTVPVQHHFGQTLDQTRIDLRQPWQRKHWGALQANYAAAPFGKKYLAELATFYTEREYAMLNSINQEMLEWTLEALGIKTKIVFATELPATGAQSSARLVELCKAVGADRYYCGRYAAEQYLDRELFAAAGVAVDLQDWTCPAYRQSFEKDAGFVKDLAVIDLLMNEGPRSLEILLSGAPEPA